MRTVGHSGIARHDYDDHRYLTRRSPPWKALSPHVVPKHMRSVPMHGSSIHHGRPGASIT